MGGREGGTPRTGSWGSETVGATQIPPWLVGTLRVSARLVVPPGPSPLPGAAGDPYRRCDLGSHLRLPQPALLPRTAAAGHARFRAAALSRSKPRPDASATGVPSLRSVAGAPVPARDLPAGA